MRLGHLGSSARRRDGFGAGGAEILLMHTNTYGGRVEPGQNMCGVESSSLEMFETWQVAGSLLYLSLLWASQGDRMAPRGPCSPYPSW